jgi:chemotaxis protein methyltransferase CheR
MNDADYEQIKPAVKAVTGVDLEFYKPNQMNRRLDSYISRVAGGSLTKFIKLIKSDLTAGAALKDFLTINVTEFFRDPRAWDELKKSILPKLLESGRPLNIWSAGCSQGSEPYTLSMILDEMAPRRQHTILATDLDAGVVERAKNAGPYTPAELKNFSAGQLATWFEEQANGHYKVAKHIRKRVTVKLQNLLLDTFETGFDLIVCRNVVIYFSDAAKRKLNERFLASLKPGGYFFIGGTETLLDAPSIGFERYATSFYRRGSANTKAAKAA